MQTILDFKDRWITNLATVLFMVGLSMLVAWLDYRNDHSIGLPVSIACIVWLLLCAVPIKAILRPRSKLLAIDGRELLWQIREDKTGMVKERRIPLDSVRALEFLTPRRRGQRDPRNDCRADLVFVTAGARYELPSEFRAGYHRKKIVAEIQRVLPDVEVKEEFQPSE